MNLQEKKREADMIRSVTFISNRLSVRQRSFSFETMNGLKRCIRSSSLNLEKEKALSLIAQKLGRTVYYMLKHNTAFEPDKFFQDGIAEPLA
jgi:hypothetical protein